MGDGHDFPKFQVLKGRGTTHNRKRGRGAANKERETTQKGWGGRRPPARRPTRDGSSSFPPFHCRWSPFSRCGFSLVGSLPFIIGGLSSAFPFLSPVGGRSSSSSPAKERQDYPRTKRHHRGTRGPATRERGKKEDRILCFSSWCACTCSSMLNKK